MANFAVGTRVKLRSGRTGRITKILLDGPMAMNQRYQVAMEPDGTLIGINGLDVLAAMGGGQGSPPQARLPAFPIGPVFPRWPDLQAALQDAVAGLSADQVRFALQGSAAAIIHGCEIAGRPGDLDICVTHIPNAIRALLQAGFEQITNQGGGRAVVKFKHANGTDVDLVMGIEFGLRLEAEGAVQRVQGVCLLSLPECLVSLILRPEQRDKERIAFASLVLRHEARLSPQDREKVLTAARLRFDPAITWDQVVDSARRAKAHFKFD